MLQTDRHRIDMWTQNSATAYNNYGAGHFWKLSHFVKQNGYVNVPLEGLWLRGPYLHNGSVPTLADLLEDPAHRPKLFYRGYDVLDPEKVGFVSKARKPSESASAMTPACPATAMAAICGAPR